MSKLRFGAVVIAGMAAAMNAAAQDTTRFTDARTGVSGWRFEDDGIRVELIQRLPDQTKAFFLGRGFKLENAARLANHCLFQTIIHNTNGHGGANIHVDLHQWRALTANGAESLLLKETWQQKWSKLGVGARQRIAFQWSFFPTVQDFAPGDWNMGMTSYPVAPGQPLNLEIVWQENGQRHHGKLSGAVCGDNDLAAEIEK